MTNSEKLLLVEWFANSGLTIVKDISWFEVYRLGDKSKPVNSQEIVCCSLNFYEALQMAKDLTPMIKRAIK